MKLFELFVTSQHYVMNKNDLANSEYDAGYNDVAVNFAKQNSKHYNRYKNGLVQLLPDKDLDAEPFNTIPQPGEIQSPGFRGRERTKQRCNLPYKKYQRYDPSQFKRTPPYGPSNIFTT